ncbi:MAG TPA: hypothetical protein VLP43_06665 [Solirubrobacteraceae bacterium]|nr:hypothetical protein [Solirubrobacteraceae bacterium]
MHSITQARVLIVAHKTADSHSLIEAVAQRAAAGPCAFTLLVPTSPRGLHRVTDPEDHGLAEAEGRLNAALPLLSHAAGSEVVGMIGGHEPLAAVQDALNIIGFDEVIVSMLPPRLSRWLHLDLPRKISALGIAVTAVAPPESAISDRPAA